MTRKEVVGDSRERASGKDRRTDPSSSCHRHTLQVGSRYCLAPRNGGRTVGPQRESRSLPVAPSRSL